MNARFFFLVISPLLVLAAGLGFRAGEARARNAAPAIYWSEDVVREMRGLVEKAYVDEVPPERARALFYGACKGYLGGLDPYCDFYTPAERSALEQENQGEFGGVGILTGTTPEGILVRAARRGDPAWTAGIRAGDVILSIDGADTRGEVARDVVHRLRGEPDTKVAVAWKPRDGGAVREASVKRSKVKIDSVLAVSMADPKAGIGYLRIGRFQENTAADLKAALARLREQGARTFVLDLRSDYGGVLPAAVACADCFLAEGEVVVTRSRKGFERPEGHRAKADPDDILDAPLVLLVDGNTASAAEILAGALQDHRRAVLVGERTYGKFLVQRIVPLDDGDEGVAVKLTTARYYTPFGRNLQRDDARGVRGGLVPDVPTPVTDAQRKSLEKAFAEQQGLDWDVLPGDPSAAPAPDDPILERALGLLRDAEAVQASSGR